MYRALIYEPCNLQVHTSKYETSSIWDRVKCSSFALTNTFSLNVGVEFKDPMLSPWWPASYRRVRVGPLLHHCRDLNLESLLDQKVPLHAMTAGKFSINWLYLSLHTDYRD